ncbi:MAG: pal [Caulobacter sp.]|nr:pal [Caulobacter sp.]
MRFNTQSVMRLALVVVAAASLAACATKPKTNPDAGQPPQGGIPDVPYRPPAGPGAVDTRPIPGSTQDFIINVGDFVYFDLDSYDVRSDAMPVLDAQAAWLRRYPNVSIRIEGNCDERGTREYNLALGSRRSNAVKDYLVSRGVSPSRIMTLSNGKERPINPGTDEEAYQQNRNGQTIITSGGM